MWRVPVVNCAVGDGDGCYQCPVTTPQSAGSHFKKADLLHVGFFSFRICAAEAG